MQDGVHPAKYKLVSAIQPTINHFVSLLKHNGRFVKVNDAFKPEYSDPDDIRRASIYLYIRVNEE